MESRWLFFDDLKNTSIRQSNNEKTGSVDDVVLDLQTGEIVLYTLSSGGFLGMGEERVALPPEVLHFREDEATLMADSQQVHKAPGTATDWPQQIDSTFIDDVRRHYRR